MSIINTSSISVVKLSSGSYRALRLRIRQQALNVGNEIEMNFKTFFDIYVTVEFLFGNFLLKTTVFSVLIFIYSRISTKISM